MNVLTAITDTLENTKDVFVDGLYDIKDAFCDFLEEDAGVTRKTLAMIVVIATLVGLIYGLVIAPKKRVIIETSNCVDDDWEE